MGIWKKNLDEANNGPVVGQQVTYQDRDFADEHQESQPAAQLNLPFEQAQQAPKPPVKTKYEIKKEMDELFENFRTVFKGKDVDTHHKQQVLVTVLGNYKNGNPDVSNRSKSLIMDLLTEFWDEV